VRPAEISQIIAWCARLTAAGSRAGTAERAAGGWASSDIDLARQAAAGARAAADASTPLAAAGTVTLEDQP
jgi:hypothetical protein